MSKNKIVFTIGFILLLMPFLGFPTSWENFISFAGGLSLIVLSFSVAAKRRAAVRRTKRNRKSDKAEFFVDGGSNTSQDNSTSEDANYEKMLRE